MSDNKNSRRSDKGEAILGYCGPGKLHGGDQIRAEPQRLGWALDKQEEQRQHVVKGCVSKGRDGIEQGPTGDQGVNHFVVTGGH